MEVIKKLMSNSSVKYTGMCVVASGLNFITLIVWGRIFSVGDYGIATTLQAFVANVSIFMIPLQMMICSLFAGEGAGENSEGIISMFGFISIIELIVLILAVDKVMEYLCLKGMMEAVLFVVLIVLNNIYTVLIGLAQGEQDFLLLGRASIILYFVKLLISVALSFVGVVSFAVIVGFTVAEIACVAMMIKKMLLRIKIPRNIHEIGVDKAMLKQYTWIFILYIVVSLCMNNGDLLLGNLYCSKEEIGLYSVAIGLAKVSVFVIAMPIATMTLPKMIAAKGEGKNQNKMLILAEMVTLGGSFLYGICFYILGGWLIPLIYGEAYKGSTEYILPCVIFSIILGMFWVFYQYILAIDLTKRFAIVTSITSIMVIIWILKVKIELRGIPIVMTIPMILAMMISVINFKTQRK